jgi:excisionase family DNA binding protein
MEKQNQQPEVRYMSPAQVASELAVTRDTVYVWLKLGILPAVRLGRTWRISSRDAFRRAQRYAPSASVAGD